MKYLFLTYWAIYILGISGGLLMAHFAIEDSTLGYSALDLFWLDNIAKISFALNSALTIMLIVLCVKLLNKDKWLNIGLFILSYIAFWGLYALSVFVYIFLRVIFILTLSNF